MAKEDPEVVQPMPEPVITFRQSEPRDIAALKTLLAAAGLPSQDVGDGHQEFIVACRGNDLVGSVGLEKYEDAALLRSFAVSAELRGLGLGSQLYDRIIAHANARGVKVAYVLTTTAERFCAARGFERVDRTSVPEALRDTPEFRSLCPASAVCMRRRLDDGAIAAGGPAP
jgi:amino-acid N-acetyltransferase